MKKLILLFALVATTAVSAQWEKGGTLHNVSLLAWNSSTHANKLATCADFASKVWGSEIKSAGRGWEMELLGRAQYLLECIDGVAKEESLQSLNTHRIASQCAKVLDSFTMGHPINNNKQQLK